MGGGNTKVKNVKFGKEVKFYYFDGYGRGEIIRMLLSFNKVQFEDIRYSFAEWPEKKATLKFSQIPILEIDGKQMAQSNSIARYVAQSYGQYPTDSNEVYQVESTNDFFEDVNSKFNPIFMSYVRDPEKKTDAIEEYFKNTLPGIITRVSDILKQNTTGSGFFVGKSLTLADFAVVSFATRILTHPDRVALSQPILDANPELVAYIKKQTEGIFKEYLSNRKQCPF